MYITGISPDTPRSKYKAYHETYEKSPSYVESFGRRRQGRNYPEKLKCDCKCAA
jgi:hypothetical protein